MGNSPQPPHEASAPGYYPPQDYPNETRNRKLLLRTTRNRIILSEPRNSKLPLQAIRNSNTQLNTRNSRLPEAQSCLIVSLHPVRECPCEEQLRRKGCEPFLCMW